MGSTSVSSRSLTLRGNSTSVALSPDNPATFCVYVDNVGVLVSDEALVSRAITETVSDFESVGLQCHTPTLGSSRCETLGVEFDIVAKGFRPTSRRYWRIKQTCHLLREKSHSFRKSA